MNNFSITIRVSELGAMYPIVHRALGDKVFHTLVRSYAHYLRRLCISMIEESMNQPRYKGEWEPTDDAYYQYIGTTSHNDILQLINESLIVDKSGDRYMIMIDKKIKYPDSPLTLLHVLNAIEYGTHTTSARPLLSNIMRDLARRSHMIWRSYLMKEGVV